MNIIWYNNCARIIYRGALFVACAEGKSYFFVRIGVRDCAPLMTRPDSYYRPNCTILQTTQLT